MYIFTDKNILDESNQLVKHILDLLLLKLAI